MPRFQALGARRETAEPTAVEFFATDAAEAQRLASSLGILTTDVREIPAPMSRAEFDVAIIPILHTRLLSFPRATITAGVFWGLVRWALIVTALTLLLYLGALYILYRQEQREAALEAAAAKIRFQERQAQQRKTEELIRQRTKELEEKWPTSPVRNP